MAEGGVLCEKSTIGSNENDALEVNLHTVESISDIHLTSTNLEVPKGAEGNNDSLPRTFTAPHGNRIPADTKMFPDEDLDFPTPEPPVTEVNCLQWPCCGPTCCRLVLYTALVGLIITSVALIVYSVHLSSEHSESILFLSHRLAYQEESIRRLRLASSQLWQRLNASEPLGPT
ncbi:leucine-rich single-pass membrane protein 2 [Lissotriton helveticus]